MTSNLPLYAVLVSGLSLPMLANAMAPEQEAFFDAIQQHCGKAYAGTVVNGNEADSSFANKPLVMHVRECSEHQIKIPFHVGDDHSRTWVITKTATGLQLKHDHRHQDGHSDKVTMYGGDTLTAGSAKLQSFPVDAFSIANFTDNGLSQSVTNVWHMGIDDNSFSYRLTRENRDFYVEFDLSESVALPPTPWGHQ
ncbi:hypothetical protein [Shewanella sp. NIFS-20-20]|uniref:hypothetical protein n=1 Tax=Shewanella sp. NIFS-20-20 TaxID=2853806 RepID=UPI001C48973C|nr:hypothetical protein [Shewanella sp. NIFS-20-20]MBV7315651.1 hypothetical protein [Shewanella sp. NIFS-20-20]